MIADRRAGVVVMFACAAAVLTMCAGLAVDATRLWMLRAKVQQAVDAAALLAAMQINTSDQNTVDWKDVRNLFWVNFSRDVPGNGIGYMGATSEGATVETPVRGDPTLVSVEAKARLPLMFGHLLGMGGEVGVASTKAVAKQGAKVEIALALDITGTMAGNMATSTGGTVTKIQAVKNAVANMLDIVYGPLDSVQDLWFSVVPFRTSVNVGATHVAWLDAAAYGAADWVSQSWRGCVEARGDGFDLKEDSPAVKPFKPFFWKSTYQAKSYQTCTSTGACTTNFYLGDNDWHGGSCGVTDTGTGVTSGCTTSAYSSLAVGPNLGCPNDAVLPLTDSKNAIKTKVAGLNARTGGSTIIHQGLQWSWLTLSPLWQNHWGLGPARNGAARPLAYTTGNLRKVIVLLSDGQSNWNGNDNDSKNNDCDPKVWPACLQTDGYYNAYGRPSENRLSITMPTGAPPQSSKDARKAMMAKLDNQASLMCTEIKKKGVEIYAVAFQVSSGSNAEKLLKNCANDASHYLNANDEAGINKAFTTIGRQLRSLRLVPPVQPTP